jgi:uncharacterized Tic20 family protein
MEESANGGRPMGLSSEDRNLSVLAHLGGFFGLLLVPVGGNILAPLILWLIKRDSSPFIEEHARESINFQITMTIAWLITGALMFVVIGFLILPILAVTDLVLVVLAAIQASRGEHYRYPFALRLLT